MDTSALQPLLDAYDALGPSMHVPLIVIGSFFLAFIVSLLHKQVVLRFTSQSENELDDIVAANTRWPLAVSIVMFGLWYAEQSLGLPAPAEYAVIGVMYSILVVMWTVALSRIVTLFLRWLMERRDRYSNIINARTEPLFDIAGRSFVYGGGLYFLFLAWDLDLTGWLASAGIVGVAVGFAAQTTLGNFIAGAVILAEAPYKLGDFLELETGERGRVTEIGLRATRILTHDDVEIIVPNSVMANSRIINASGGPWEKFRASTIVEVSYTSDIDLVRAVLLQVPKGIASVEDDPAPQVHFQSFGASGLVFRLMVWVERPGVAPRVIDQLNTRIYKAFAEHGIEIPYQKIDLYIKETVRPADHDWSGGDES